MSDRYMMGGCHYLAVAMHRLTGWDLAVVAGPYQGSDAIFHVCCLDREGNAWDVRGRHAPSDLVDEQVSQGHEAWIVRLAGEADVWRLAQRDPGLLNPMHPTHVIEALETAHEVLGEDVDLVSDGWRPHDEASVDAACDDLSPVPDIGSAKALSDDGAKSEMKP